MGIALSSILLLFILLPGLIFRRFYYSEEFSKEYFKESIPSFFISTVIPSAVIHILGWQIVTGGYNLDPNTIAILFSGTDDAKIISTAFVKIHAKIDEIIWYFILLSLLGGLLGYFSKLIVRNLKLDRKIKFFRFQNEWHYLFSGEILDFSQGAWTATRD